MRLEPRVVRWLVGSSGMARGDIARRMGVDEGEVDGWIRTGRMTYARMQRLAACLKRPGTAFMLREPVVEAVPTDYRWEEDYGVDDVVDDDEEAAADGALGPTLSPRDRVTFRGARYRQSEAGERMGLRGGDVAPKLGGCRCTVDDSYEEAAGRLRAAAAKAAAAGKKEWPGNKPAPAGLGAWRDAVESKNILVFQDRMDADAVRVISMAGHEPYVILLNAGDAEATRSFALLHGYGHALLGTSGICKEAGMRGCGAGSAERLAGEERWCDSFAAAVLMPRRPFEAEWRRISAEGRAGSETARSVVGGLSGRFGASMYAAAVRAADVTGDGERRADYAGLAVEVANRPGTSHGGPARTRKGKSPAALCEARFGRRFVRLVMAAHDAGEITTHDVIQYLDIRLGDIDDVHDAALELA